MYGSIFRIKVKPGQEQKLIDVFKEWDRDRKPKVSGVVHSLLLKPDKKPNELIGVAIFKDKATYSANADDPEQDKWYRQMREYLEENPSWEDSEFIMADIS